MPPCKDLSPLAGFVKIMLHFLPLDFSLCVSKTFNFFHSKHGPHQSPSENPFLVHFTKLCAPCAPCVSKGGTCSQISQLKTFASQTVHHIVRASCASVGGDLFTFFLKTCNVHLVVRGAPPWGRLRRQSVSSSFTRSPPRWWCGQPAGDDTILQTIFNQAIFININADTKSPPNQSFHLILNFHKYLQ